MEYYENTAIINADNEVRKDLTKKDILDHLAMAKEKEAEIYALQLLIRKMREKMPFLYVDVNAKREEFFRRHKGNTGVGIGIIVWCLFWLYLIITQLSGTPDLTTLLFAGFMILIPILLYVLMHHTCKCEQKKINELDEIADAKREILEGKISEIESYIEQKRIALDNFYAKYDIIYPKYRHFAAVSTIWEYLASERCDTLTGPYGAYNVFENEVRMNRIVSNLEDVSKTLRDIANTLELIKGAQYALYEAITGAKLYVDNIDLDVDYLSEHKEDDIIEKIRRNSFSL